MDRTEDSIKVEVERVGPHMDISKVDRDKAWGGYHLDHHLLGTDTALDPTTSIHQVQEVLYDGSHLQTASSSVAVVAVAVISRIYRKDRQP